MLGITIRIPSKIVSKFLYTLLKDVGTQLTNFIINLDFLCQTETANSKQKRYKHFYMHMCLCVCVQIKSTNRHLKLYICARWFPLITVLAL